MKAFLAFTVFVLLAGAGCGGATEEAPPPTETSPPAAAAAPPAPNIEGITLEGERLSLADFRGRPVFVNVWSSW